VFPAAFFHNIEMAKEKSNTNSKKEQWKTESFDGALLFLLLHKRIGGHPDDFSASELQANPLYGFDKYTSQTFKRNSQTVVNKVKKFEEKQTGLTKAFKTFIKKVQTEWAELFEGNSDNDEEDEDFNPEEDEEDDITQMTRYGQIIKQPKRFGFDYYALTVAWDVFHDDGYSIQEEMNDPIAFHPHAFAASSNPDILYLQEAQAADDWPQFREAMAKEIESHKEMDHWELARRDALPPKTKVLPAVWAMRQKRRISTQEVYKWKAWINLHGGRQTKDVNYWETYSSVVGWSTIRMFLILMLVNKRQSKQIDFVLAFPQAPICPVLQLACTKVVEWILWSLLCFIEW